jgi:hypothetical protein
MITDIWTSIMTKILVIMEYAFDWKKTNCLKFECILSFLSFFKKKKVSE